MFALILVVEVLGYERWKKYATCPSVFLGARPNGEIRKLVKGGGGGGGDKKGPAKWQLRTSVKRFCSKMSWCR